MRVGMHVGTPRRLGEDYLGVDVNVADHAAGGAVIGSGDALELLDPERFGSRKKLLSRAKGVPTDVTVYSLEARR